MKFAEILKRKSSDNYGNRPPVIAFLGDSITQGCFEFEKKGKNDMTFPIVKRVKWNGKVVGTKSIIYDVDILSIPSEPLTFLTEQGAKTEEGEEIISKIKEVMEANTELLALSAPQIGINKRIFCLRFNDQIKTFINPIITKEGPKYCY